MASDAARLSRAYVAQVESLCRLRNGGSQFVRVEHVHVNEGGQAVIGNVRSTPVRDEPPLASEFGGERSSTLTADLVEVTQPVRRLGLARAPRVQTDPHKARRRHFRD
jgi:hypothetical protein